MKNSLKKMFAYFLTGILAFSGLLTQTQNVFAATSHRLIVNDPVAENVDVGYFMWNSKTSDSDINNRGITPLTKGFTNNDFYRTQASNGDKDKMHGYIIFFIKPKSNYLLVNTQASGMNRQYNINSTNIGDLGSYQENRGRIVVNKAKAAGYQGAFGYSRLCTDSTGDDVYVNINVKAVQPSITVDAKVDKTSDVEEGDVINVEFKVTPQTVIEGTTLTVEDVGVESVTVGTNSVAIDSFVSNGDGTYTGKGRYTVTAADVAKNELNFTVSAKTDYEYSFGLSNDVSDKSLITKAQIKNSDTEVIKFAAKSSYEYSYEYVANGVKEADYPEEIKTAPSGKDKVSLGSPINLEAEKATVTDTKNNGLWYFDGWYLNGTKVTGQLTQTAERMNFVGKWTFTKLDVTGEDTAYDGKDHGIKTKDIIGAKDQSQWTYEYSESENGPWTTEEPKFKDAGEHQVFVKAKNGNDELISSTTVRITQKELSVKTGSKEMDYTGKALTFDEITVVGAVEGDILSYETTGSQTEAGSSKNTYKINWSGDKSKNYTIKEDLGTLKVNKVKVDLSDENRFEWNKPEDKIYNGQEQKWTPSIKDKVTGKDLVEGVDYEVDYRNQDDFTNAGDINVTIKGKGNYEGEFNTSYKITKRKVTLTAKSKEKVYDGNALTEKGYKVSEDGFVKGEGLLDVTVVGEQTYVGSSSNEIKDYKLNAKTKAENYEITLVAGLLTVTAGTDKEPVDADKVVTKTHDDSKEYKLGDVIKFTIKATNIYGEAKDMTIEEQAGVNITGNTVFKGVKPGETVTTTAEYTVTEADILNGTIYTNTVKVKFAGEKDFENKDEVKIEAKQSKLVVNKTTVSKPKNGATYTLGEVIEYEISVSNVGNLTVKDIEVKDELTGDKWTVKELAPGKTSDPVKVTHTVTEEDVLKGTVFNTATAKGNSTDTENPETEVVPGEKSEAVQEAKASYEIIKEADAGEYKVGDKVNYRIRVINNGNVTIKDIDVEDKLTGGKWHLDSLKPNTEEVFNTQYVITEADVIKGTVKNIATAKGTDPKGKDIEAEGVKEITPEALNAHMTVNKTTVSTPKNGKTYALGEKIKYNISVTNDGNVTLHNIKVKDELTGDEWTVKELAPGQTSKTFKTTYKVTEKDVLNGTVVNTATASSDDIKGDVKPGVEPGKQEENIDAPKGSFKVTKTAKEGTYKLGETVTYEIKVENDGNVTVKDINIVDELTKDEWTIEELAPGEEKVFTAEYVITEADVINGKITNTVTVKGTDPDGKEVDGDGKEVITPEAANPHMTVNKKTVSTPKNGKTYALGEEIEYEINVTNDGNITLTNVLVKDELTGDEWTVKELAPGQTSKTFKTTYKVTEKDVLNGTVVNTATASSDDIKGDVKPGVEPGKQEENIDAPKGSFKVTKTAKEGTYKLGETVTYEIKVENDGNVTVKDINIVDELTKDEWTIEELAPGEEKVFTAEYVITEADVINGKITNTVTVKGTDPDGKEVDGDGKEVITPEAANPHMTVNKKTVSTPKNGKTYVLGEEIKYEIIVTNDGNVTLTNVIVKDELTGDEWTVKELTPGHTSETFKTTYKVTEKDLLNGSVVNTATASSDDIKENVKPEVEPGKQESKVEDVKSSIIVDKKAKEGIYKVGEKVTYEITVKNNGNVTVSGIKVVDKLTGDSWTIDNLKPGEERAFTTKYTLTKADEERGFVKNVVTVEGLDPNGKSVDVNGEATIKVEKTKKAVKVTNKPTVNKVKTGDESKTTLYVELGLMSVLGYAILFLKNKKSKLLKK